MAQLDLVNGYSLPPKYDELFINTQSGVPNILTCMCQCIGCYCFQMQNQPCIFSCCGTYPDKLKQPDNCSFGLELLCLHNVWYACGICQCCYGKMKNNYSCGKCYCCCSSCTDCNCLKGCCDGWCNSTDGNNTTIIVVNSNNGSGSDSGCCNDCKSSCCENCDCNFCNGCGDAIGEECGEMCKCIAGIFDADNS